MKYILFSIIISASTLFCSCSKSSEASGISNSSSGNSTGGSMARFTLVDNYLYTINNQSLKTFNVSNPASPVLENTISVGSNIETIFPFKGNLFIGSATRLYVYSLNNPGKPAPLSATSYQLPFRGRDPVVTNDTLAYSSVRNANGSGSLLYVTDVRNPQNTRVVNQIFSSASTYGLGLADTALYLCAHSAGLNVYSLKTDPTNPSFRKIISNSEVYYDVIPSGNLLYTWIEGGNSIFDITARMNPVQLSKTKN